MATHASSKKDSSQKSTPKADPPASKTAQPAPATDLISSPRKKSQSPAETRTRSAVPPISKAQKPAPAAPASSTPAIAPEPAQPSVPTPSKPESVSLIDDNRSKRSETSSSEPKQRSVLPPISKIRAPAPKPAAPPNPVVHPAPAPVATIEPPEPSSPATSDEKIIHIKPP